MHAAVVTSFGSPPRYQEHPEPVATRQGEAVVDVLAAALYPRVRSQAGGSHYTSTDQLPLIPGIDAVVRDDRGRLRYALLDDTTLGTMAERTVIELDRSVVLPKGTDPVAIAAAMNPVMSSWVALRQRIRLRRGQSVLVLGATGNSGRMAIQVATMLGARSVFAAGRDLARLEPLKALGADRTLRYDDLTPAADVDVVLDYVWGSVTASAMIPLLTARRDRSQQLTWIQIGSMAGLESPLPSAAFRSARLTLVGSGIGSVDGRDYKSELPAIAKAVSRGDFDVHPRAVPLADVETAWTETLGAEERIVFVP